MLRDLLYYAISIYIYVLFARLIADWVFTLSRARAHGPVAMFLELVYSLTDPPIKLLRRLIPPLRIGGFALDLGFIVLLLVLYAVRGQIYRL